MFNCRDLIAKVPFLRRDLKDGRDEMFSRRIASALQPVYYTQGDRIIEQGRVSKLRKRRVSELKWLTNTPSPIKDWQ